MIDSVAHVRNFVTMSVPPFFSRKSGSALEQYTLQWSNDAFLYNPGLRAETVLDYVRMSVFYDKSCINERLRAQGLPHPDESSEELGLRYVRLPSKFEPNLFIIKMQHVVKQNNVLDVRDIALYYVNLGVMYQAPNVRSLVMARMQNCADRIKKAFDLLQSRVKFDPPGYRFRLKAGVEGGEAGNDDETKNTGDDSKSRKKKEKCCRRFGGWG